MVSDSGNAADIDALAKRVAEEFDSLDILILNAGITPFAPLGNWTPENFSSLFDINVRGPYLAVQRLADQLGDNGSIVLIGSIASHRGGAATAVYGSTKAALALIGKGLVPTLAGRGIRVNTVTPGPVDTPAWNKTGLPTDVVEAVREARVAAHPMGRYGSAGEIAEAIAFIASPAASYINGAELVVDGGLTAS